jgi:hypothetical protein
LKKILNIALPVLISAGLFYWFLQGANPTQLWNNMLQANLGIVAVTILIALFAHFLRALRWILLLNTLGLQAKPLNGFLAVMTAYFGNIFIPRAGELMRCVVLNKSDGIPIESGFATVVAERVIDFLCLLTLIGFALLFEFDRFYFFINEKILKANPSGSTSMLKYYVLGGAILMFAISFIFRKRLLQISLVQKIWNFIATIFKQAYEVVFKLKNRGLFLTYTLFIWVCYYFMTYLIFFAMPATAHLGPMAGLVILIAGGLGMSAPSSGGIGTFHFIVATGLTLFYGLEKSQGEAYAAVVHTSQLLTMLLLGGTCSFIAYYVIGNSRTKA